MKATVESEPTRTMTPSWDLVKPSYQLLKANIEPVLFIMLLPALVSILGSLLAGTHYLDSRHFSDVTSKERIGLVLSVISGLWSIVNLGPSTLLQLRAVDKKPLTVSQLYRQGLPYTLRLLGFYIVFALSIFIGLVLLIVPGLIILRRYLLTPYYITDKNMSMTKAMKQSSKDSKPVKGYVWGVIGVQIVFYFVAALLQVIPLIGAIVAELVTFTILFTIALRYREIQPATSK